MATFSVKSGVAILKLNSPPVNGLGHLVRMGLLRGLEKSLTDKCEAIVLSGEGKNFSAGADITEFARGGHTKHPDLNHVIETLDSFPIPVIAAINGNALGGGLETALACHWRIGCSTTRIGLPEVHLGLLPGAGGTQRLPRLIGVETSLDLISTGKIVDERRGFELGIIDHIIANNDLIGEAIAFAHSDRVRKGPLSDRIVSLRNVPGNTSDELFSKLRKSTEFSAKGYAAPVKILAAIEASVLSSTFEEGMKKERELFQELMRGNQSKSLQYFFFSERRSGNLSVDVNVKVPNIESVAVIGGGTMGAGITMAMINAGIATTLLESSKEKADEAVKRIEKIFKSSSAYKSGKQTDVDVSKRMNLIIPTGDINGLASADLVIEAVFENMETKKDIFKSIDGVCKPSAILATNTSYLDVDEIARSTSRPSKVLGTHFFSPANIMKLLEIVKGSTTAPEVIAACAQLGKKIGKTSVIAGNCFGFIGNRMLLPYSQEAHFLLEEGATPSQIDRVLKRDVGLAMGIFEMLDLAGNDVGWRLRLGQGLTGPKHASDSGSASRYCTLADKLCESGNFGQKTGRGWYRYDPSNPRKALESAETLDLILQHRLAEGIVARDITDQEILERCMYSLVNEGFKILEEKIAQRPEDIDVVQVYGYGFPKYRGGPMFWSEKEVKLQTLLVAVKAYYEKFPNSPWWQPSALLQEIVSSGATVREELYFREKNRKPQ